MPFGSVVPFRLCAHEYLSISPKRMVLRGLAGRTINRYTPTILEVKSLSCPVNCVQKHFEFKISSVVADLLDRGTLPGTYFAAHHVSTHEIAGTNLTYLLKLMKTRTTVKALHRVWRPALFYLFICNRSRTLKLGTAARVIGRRRLRATVWISG